MLKKRISEKGFLGPIGDDLPSLIPLLFALLIFFSTFSFTYSVFSTKNEAFQRDIDVLNISRGLKGTNYVAGHNSFMESCNSLDPTNLSYRAVVTNFFTAPENYCPENGCDLSDLSGIKIFDLKPYSLEGNLIECAKGEFPDDPQEFFEENNFVSKVYPLVVEDKRIVKPMHLVVIAWAD